MAEDKDAAAGAEKPQQEYIVVSRKAVTLQGELRRPGDIITEEQAGSAALLVRRGIIIPRRDPNEERAPARSPSSKPVQPFAATGGIDPQGTTGTSTEPAPSGGGTSADPGGIDDAREDPETKEPVIDPQGTTGVSHEPDPNTKPAAAGIDDAVEDAKGKVVIDPQGTTGFTPTSEPFDPKQAKKDAKEAEEAAEAAHQAALRAQESEEDEEEDDKGNPQSTPAKPEDDGTDAEVTPGDDGVVATTDKDGNEIVDDSNPPLKVSDVKPAAPGDPKSTEPTKTEKNAAKTAAQISDAKPSPTSEAAKKEAKAGEKAKGGNA